MTIQLFVGARGKTRAGEIVEIVNETGDDQYPFESNRGLTYTSAGTWAVGVEDEDDIIELIPPRQYVDTPFEVGKTYPTRNGKNTFKVIGLALAVEDEDGGKGYRGIDGFCCPNIRSDYWDIIPTPIEDKPKQTVTLELTDEQLAKVREALK